MTGIQVAFLIMRFC